MEITFELIFSVVTALVTAVLGTIFKDRVVPARFIPVQNIIIGLIAAFVAVYYGLFNDVATAIIISLALSLGVGGAYDALKTKKEEEK